MKEPELITATQQELDELLALARTSFPDKQYKLLEGVLGTFVFVMLKMQNAKTSIKRLQQMLFGARTESKRNLALVPAPSSASAPAVTADSAVVDGQGDPAGQTALSGSLARPEIGAGVRSWHLRLSRDHIRPGAEHARRPRHFLICRFEPALIVVGRVLHDAMELARHLDPDTSWR